MAQAVACDGCGNESAITMITDMETGQSTAIGVMCTPVYHANTLTAIIGQMPDDALEVYAPLLAPLERTGCAMWHRIGRKRQDRSNAVQLRNRHRAAAGRTERR